MTRGPRQESATGIHHVMNRGVNRQAVFFDDADRVEMGRRLTAIHERFEVHVLAYCLMTNHIHLLLRAPSGSLPEAMHHLTSVYARHTNDRAGRDGPLFRGRYLSIPVETDDYLAQAARYIHRNPLDIVGGESPEQYRWSSLRTYAGLRRVASFMDLHPVLALYDGGVAQLVEHTLSPDRSLPGAPSNRVAPTGGDLLATVRYAIALDDLGLGDDERGRQGLERTVLTVLAARGRVPGLDRVIAELLGDREAKAESAARRRANRRWTSDPSVRRVVGWLEAELGPGDHYAPAV